MSISPVAYFNLFVDLTHRIFGRYYIWREEANYLDVRRIVYNLVIFMLIICGVDPASLPKSSFNPFLLSTSQRYSDQYILLKFEPVACVVV
jgi:hypothetical protein